LLEESKLFQQINKQLKKMINTINFNNDWLFRYEGLKTRNTDNQFSPVSLPHDYSIELGYNQELGDGATGFLIGGLATYKKSFKISDEMRNKKLIIFFDGIFGDSSISINGIKVCEHHNGSTVIPVDITNYLNDGEEQLIEVSVDHSHYIDTRWYSGSGIYRDVKLLVLDKTYIEPLSEKVESNVDGKVKYSFTLVNEKETDEKLTLQYCIKSPNGDVIKKDCEERVSANTKKDITITDCIDNPLLWDVEMPNLYTFTIKINDDEYSTKFGMREITVDPDQGFFLNERAIKIKGVCLHQDGGLVGAALTYDVIKRRLMKLKMCGCNAIRGAHNPLSEVFLNVCDDIGLLVQEEFFDEWDYPKDKRHNMKEQKPDYLTDGYNRYFHKNCKKDIQDTIKTHINHPSIFMWSIGNEIEWTYDATFQATGYFGAQANGDYFWQLPPSSKEEIKKNYQKARNTDQYKIEETAKLLSDYVREIDDTRIVTANCIFPSAAFACGYSEALDVVGCSYRRVMYDSLHDDYPEKPIMGTENLGQYHEWKAVKERAFVGGLFLWTGINYIGETHKNGWPVKANKSGLLDTAGFEKPSYYLFKSLFSNKPSTAMFTQTCEKSSYRVIEGGEIVDKQGLDWKKKLWVFDEVNNHYNYKDGDELIVEIYSNEESIELFQNGVSLGTKYLVDMEDGIYKFAVRYREGSLKAVGKHSEAILNTAADLKEISLVCDKKPVEIGDVSHVVLSLIDENGNEITDREADVEFSFDGTLRLLGYDNGSCEFVSSHKEPKLSTNKGKALVMVMKTDSNQSATITASLENGISQRISL
jgi:hypothetical protein